MNDINAIDVIEKLPYDLAARLEADGYFCDIPVVVADEGNVKATIAARQAVITQKSGKAGVAVIVLQIVADDDFPELAFGPMTLRPAFQVIEQREINQGPAGTKKSARKVARRIRDVIKLGGFDGLIEGMTAEEHCIVPVRVDTDKLPNTIAFQVNFKCYERDDQVLNVTAIPQFTDNGDGTVALTCLTPGALVYYTLDDSYPSAQNATAIAYGATPVAIPPTGAWIRAAAYLPGALCGGAIRAFIS